MGMNNGANLGQCRIDNQGWPQTAQRGNAGLQKWMDIQFKWQKNGTNKEEKTEMRNFGKMRTKEKLGSEVTAEDNGYKNLS